jgi:LysM repeat protein
LLSLRQPIFLSRNLIVASLGYYLLVTGIVLKFRSRKAAIALVLPLVAMNLISIGHNAWREEKENWRAAAAYVALDAQGREEGLLLFVPSYAELPFRYYFQRYGLALETQGYPEDEILLHPEPKKVDDAAATLEGRPVVWLILRDVEAVDPNSTVKGWLDTRGYVRTGDLITEDLTVITYVRWDLLTEVPSPSPTKTLREKDAAKCETASPEASCHSAPGQGGEGTILQQDTRGHVVRGGETLSGITLRYDVSVESLARANQIENLNRIYIGQELFIPQDGFETNP